MQGAGSVPTGLDVDKMVPHVHQEGMKRLLLGVKFSEASQLRFLRRAGFQAGLKIIREGVASVLVFFVI